MITVNMKKLSNVMSFFGLGSHYFQGCVSNGHVRYERNVMAEVSKKYLPYTQTTTMMMIQFQKRRAYDISCLQNRKSYHPSECLCKQIKVRLSI